MAHSHDSTTLDLPLPARRHQTLGLVLVRRIAGHGLHDARATMLALDASGAEFRRLLVLTRALVVDLARTSRRKILLAPCGLYYDVENVRFPDSTIEDLRREPIRDDHRSPPFPSRSDEI